MKKVSLIALMLVAGANVNAANYYVGGKIGYTDAQTVTYVNDEVSTGSDKRAGAFDYSVAAGVKADDVRFEAEIESMTFAEINKDVLKTKSISLMSNVYYDVNLQKLAGVSVPVMPYAFAGLGFSHTDTQAKVSGEWKDVKALTEKKAALWQIGAGVAYEVMPMVTVDAGYKYQRAFAESANDGKNFIKNTQHSVVFGARYNF